jgi:hypothetical protein
MAMTLGALESKAASDPKGQTMEVCLYLDEASGRHRSAVHLLSNETTAVQCSEAQSMLHSIASQEHGGPQVSPGPHRAGPGIL